MCWFVPFLVGFLSIYLVRKLMLTSTVDIRGKFVLITGCDSGFGRETAIRLDKMGVCVLATCLTQQGEESLKSVTSKQLQTFQLDVTNAQQVKEVYEEVKGRIPSVTGLWGLVNNAGIIFSSPIEWTPVSTFKRLADVNLWGMVDVTKTFLPLLKNAKGRVVNMSSTVGRVAINLAAAYSVTKYGVEGFSDVLRREMHPWGIKVSMVEPGAHQTPMTDPRSLERQFRQAWSELSAELQKDYGPEYLEKGISFMTSYEKSPKTYQVVDAIVEALSSQRPRDRYLVGVDARFLFSWMTLIPATVADTLMRILLKPPAPQASK